MTVDKPALAKALAKARAAKKKAQVALSAEQPTGIGLSQRADHYVITVLLSAPLSDETTCPNVIDGVPVEFEVVGQVSKLSADTSSEMTTKAKPKRSRPKAKQK